MFSSVHKYIYADWERFASKRSEEKKNTRKYRFSTQNLANHPVENKSKQENQPKGSDVSPIAYFGTK
jgi:hypothetical protein